MTRLLVHVEGQTEEQFVNELLAPHLRGFGYSLVSARMFGNARQRHRRGGVKPWQAVKRDVVRHLREDNGSISTIMVDYYGMPATGEGAWPGREASQRLAHEFKASSIEEILYQDVANEMGGDGRRFVPFVLMHEFEALLFSDCEAFAKGVGRSDLADSIQAVRDQFDCPERINDSPQTAPSKRAKSLISNYQKPLFGVLAALEIGLPRIRAECAHFASWLSRLERAPIV